MKITIIGLVLIVLGASLWFLFLRGNDGGMVLVTPTPTQIPSISFTPKPTVSPVEPVSIVVQNVPFAAQAPFGDWSDPRQQDGCEEASAIMAMRWVKGQSLTLQQMLDEIKAISAFEEQTYGSYHDTSADDTVARIFGAYFNYQNAEARHDITVEDIKVELSKGNLVIIPADGQKLGNPYFTAPGPERHMLLIKGYDPKTRQFITNDPGTRQGKDFRYSESVLFSAIRDYTTGYHEPIIGNEKAMIVVSK